MSITVRLADGRIIDARISPGSFSPQLLGELYTVGDQVEIVCAPGDRVYYPMLARNLSLELKKLKFLREPSDEERSRAMKSRAWREGCRTFVKGTPCNLLQRPTLSREVPAIVGFGQSESANEARLDLIRSRVLAFVRAMPNFVADEVAKRYASPRDAPPQWRLVDTVESEVTFRGSRDSKAHIKFNGKPWDQPYEMLPGTKNYSGFGTDLPGIFNRTCPTTLKLEGLVRNGNGPAGKTGRVLLDEQEENVIRIEADSKFPPEFPVAANHEEVEWGYVKIGDETHLLPVSSEFIFTYPNGSMSRVHAEYKNHRHFEASSTIKFQP